MTNKKCRTANKRFGVSRAKVDFGSVPPVQAFVSVDRTASRQAADRYRQP
jgi:hypothetical protein